MHSQKGDWTMTDPIDRRRFLGLSAVAGLVANRAGSAADAASDPPAADKSQRSPAPFLTESADFVDVSRGSPKPFMLRGEALVRARLTPETWRVEVVSDASAEIERPARIENGKALDLASLKAMGRVCRVKYLKAMKCNNIPFPLGQRLWEEVPLR